jgi:hypothetical protein
VVEAPDPASIVLLDEGVLLESVPVAFEVIVDVSVKSVPKSVDAICVLMEA